MNDKIISVLIGLIGACSSNPKTENTDALVIKALAYDSDSDIEIQIIIEEIRTEKNRIAPECAMCASPCGNTSDYDMHRIEESDEEIHRLKRQILYTLHDIAIGVNRLSDSEIDLLYKAIAYVGYDLEAESLQAVLDELNTVKRKGESK